MNGAGQDVNILLYFNIKFSNPGFEAISTSILIGKCTGFVQNLVCFRVHQTLHNQVFSEPQKPVQSYEVEWALRSPDVLGV
jgi:hypothetical protein